MSRPAGRFSAPALQTAFLFAVDGVANAVDYVFHVYLGRSLTPDGFAIVQTVNAALLIVVTAAGVLQPVVARYVAQARSGTDADATLIPRAIFGHYLRLATLYGVALSLAVWLGRGTIARALNVPAAAVAICAAMMFLALSRPVIAGMLQGQQRFVAFGLTRTAFAGGRLLLALIFVGALGGGALAAVATLPLGAGLALVVGLALLGAAVWESSPPVPEHVRRQGWRLSLGALVAYTAYMGLLNDDLIWVNRAFSSATAGSYATAVLLRRVLSLLPGAVVVILYPRVAARAAQGRPLDPLLARAMAAVILPSLALTALYFVLGAPLIRWTFGPQYLAAAPWLGWLGVAMTGYALVAVWMNTFLATRPAPYVALLAAAAMAQLILYAIFQATLTQIMLIFAGSGWFLAVAGLLLYVFWLRRRLATTRAG